MENLGIVDLADEQSDIEQAEKIRQLRAMLPILDYEARIAIRLRFWECMAIQEIASVLELSWDATDRLIEDSIARLRERFEKLESEQRFLAAS